MITEILPEVAAEAVRVRPTTVVAPASFRKSLRWIAEYESKFMMRRS
jgi:hypothetical protein